VTVARNRKRDSARAHAELEHRPAMLRSHLAVELDVVATQLVGPVVALRVLVVSIGRPAQRVRRVSLVSLAAHSAPRNNVGMSESTSPLCITRTR